MANTSFINEAGTTPSIHPSAVIDGLIDCIHKVSIDKDVFTGHDVTILTGGHDPYRFGEQRKASNGGGPVTIHEGVWIASKAMIIGPSEIGQHSVIGAGAVVRGDIPAYSMVIGNPGVVVKKLI